MTYLYGVWGVTYLCGVGGGVDDILLSCLVCQNVPGESRSCVDRGHGQLQSTLLTLAAQIMFM